MKLLLLLLPLLLSANYAKDYSKLTAEQKTIIQHAFNFGKHHDLSWTLAAKVWEESDAGERVISTNDHSKYGRDYGITQVNIYWFLKSKHTAYTKANIAKFASKLVRNDNYALQAAVDNIKRWQRRYPTNYREVWAHYNGGNTPNYEYANRIAKRIQVLKKHMKG